METSLAVNAQAADREEIVKVEGAEAPNSNGRGDDNVVHVTNWLKSMQSHEQPNVNVDHGFSHSIVIIMAAQSYWSGNRLHWNPQNEEIVDHLVAR